LTFITLGMGMPSNSLSIALISPSRIASSY
jgi:hypothetical protein